MTDDLNRSLQKLIDRINEENSTSLRVNEVLFGPPVPYASDQRPQANTSVTLTAAPNSNYKGSLTIYYRRIALEDVLNLTTPYQHETALWTHELLPELNDRCGLDLLSVDIVNESIEPWISEHPERQRIVTLTARQDSYHYTGAVPLILGPQYTPTATDLRVWILTDEGLQVRTGEGVPPSDTRLFANMVEGGVYEIQSVHPAIDQHLRLYGSFEGTCWVNDVEEELNCNSVLINKFGVIVGHDDVGDPSLYQSLVYDPARSIYYGIDGSHQLVKLSSVFEPIALIDQYEFQWCRIDTQGRLYTVTQPVSTDDGLQVRLLRWTHEFVIDPTWTPVRFRCSDPNLAPLRIVDLCPRGEDGIFLAIDPTYGVDQSSPHPIVNDVALVQQDERQLTAYTWCPVLAFHDDGSMVTTWPTVLSDRYHPAVHVPTGATRTGRIVFSSFQSHQPAVQYLAYCVNGVTGFTHDQLQSYSPTGELELVHEAQRYQQPKWTQYLSGHGSLSGQVVLWGRIQWLHEKFYRSPTSAVVLHGPQGHLERVLWQGSGSIRMVYVQEALATETGT